MHVNNICIYKYILEHLKYHIINGCAKQRYITYINLCETN